MCLAIRERHLKSRAAFWRRRIPHGSPFPPELKARLDPHYPLPGWALERLPADKSSLRILDLNAGPLTAVGTYSERVKVSLTAIDELAPVYDALLSEHAIIPNVRTQYCRPDAVAETFGKQSFDLVYTYNGLHSTDDPVPAYRHLLTCLSPGGRILSFHDLYDDPEHFHRERDCFFHWIKNGRVVIRKKQFLRDLADFLPGADLDWRVENGVLRLQLIKHVTPRPANRVPFGPRSTAAGGLPAIVSMHIPKTGGSSFKQYLTSLYGYRLRCLYSTEETRPDKVDSLSLAPETQCLHGHFQADAFEQHLPNALKVTWVRDPVERVVSSYFQYKRSLDRVRDSAFGARFLDEKWSLMDFARTEEMRYHVLWHFNAVPLDNFFFIGITEQFDVSLRLFCHLMDRPVPEDSLRENINPEKRLRQRYALPGEQRRELEELYSEEYALYRTVQYRMEEQARGLQALD